VAIHNPDSQNAMSVPITAVASQPGAEPIEVGSVQRDIPAGETTDVRFDFTPPTGGTWTITITAAESMETSKSLSFWAMPVPTADLSALLAAQGMDVSRVAGIGAMFGAIVVAALALMLPTWSEPVTAVRMRSGGRSSSGAPGPDTDQTAPRAPMSNANDAPKLERLLRLAQESKVSRGQEIELPRATSTQASESAASASLKRTLRTLAAVRPVLARPAEGAGNAVDPSPVDSSWARVPVANGGSSGGTLAALRMCSVSEAHYRSLERRIDSGQHIPYTPAERDGLETLSGPAAAFGTTHADRTHVSVEPLGISIVDLRERGAVRVTETRGSGPAARAGIKAGDVLVRIASVGPGEVIGGAIRDGAHLSKFTELARDSRTIYVTLHRESRYHVLPVQTDQL
jgi:hypothetical protein